MSSPVSPAAIAQTSDEDRFVRDEIIVTARKTEESLQDVSLSITAFTKDDIEKRSLTELENVALQTPGFSFEDFSNGGFGAPVIRGTSQVTVNQLEQNVSVFYDGIYIPRQYAFDNGVANIDRIEVVKGPQSALYGANSFSGAINYVTPNRSLTEFSGNAEVAGGIDGLFEASGSLTVPVIKDFVAISGFASHSEFDGEFDNNFPGAEDAPRRGTDDTIGGWNRQAVGAGITVEKNGFTAKGDFTHFDALNEVRPGFTLINTAQNGAPAGLTDFNCGSGLFGGFVGFCGELPTDPGPGFSGIEGLTVLPRSFLEVSTNIFRAEGNYKFNDNFDITYLYGNVSSDVFSVGGSDRDPVVGSSLTFASGFTVSGNATTFTPDGGIDYDTHEIRLNYQTDSGISFLLGGYLLNGEDRDRFSAEFSAFDQAFVELTDSPVGGDFTIIDTDIRAIFGRAVVPVTDNITISAEARYSETDKDQTADVVGADLVTSRQTLSTEDTAFTPRVNIDWNVNDDILLYASFAQGVKAGGVNQSFVLLTEEETFFDEDENTTFEIGAKTSFLDGRGTLNLAAYTINWDNLQIGVSPENATLFTGGIIENLGDARSRGFEADGTFYLTDNIAVNAGIAYVDATYSDGTLSSRARFLCDDVVCNNNGDISGNDLARVPDFQWNIGAQYDGNWNDYDYFLRGDLAGQSSQFASEFNITTIESRTLANLRAGVSRGPVSVDLYVTNLFDEIYVANSFFILNAFTQQLTASLGNGRRAGIEVSYDF